MTLWPRIATSPTSPGRHRGAGVVHQAHLHAGDRGADRARLADPVRMVERGHRRCLRQPVALQDRAAERVLEAAQDLDRAGPRRPTRTAGARTRRPRRGPGDAAAPRTSSARPRRSSPSRWLIISRAAPGSNRGSRARRGAAEDGRVQAAGQAEAVEQRQAPHDHVARAGAEQRRRGHLGVAEQVGVGQLGALGEPGRPRGVEDHGVVVVGALGPVPERRPAAEQGLRVRAP